MSTFKLGYIGDTVYVQAMSSHRLYIDDHLWVARGYVAAGLPQPIVICAVHSHFLIDEHGALYAMAPQHGDDFYIVVPAPATDMITIPCKVHDRLQSESTFLAALVAAGVDNWEGYAEARLDDEDRDENEEEEDEQL